MPMNHVKGDISEGSLFDYEGYTVHNYFLTRELFWSTFQVIGLYFFFTQKLPYMLFHF